MFILGRSLPCVVPSNLNRKIDATGLGNFWVQMKKDTQCQQKHQLTWSTWTPQFVHVHACNLRTSLTSPSPFFLRETIEQVQCDMQCDVASPPLLLVSHFFILNRSWSSGVTCDRVGDESPRATLPARDSGRVPQHGRATFRLNRCAECLLHCPRSRHFTDADD